MRLISSKYVIFSPSPHNATKNHFSKLLSDLWFEIIRGLEHKIFVINKVKKKNSTIE
jgi:hypothetical protein